MGNRTGSPPEQYRDDDDDELPENQPETDDTQQTGIGDVTEPERDDEETPSTDPDTADDPSETREGGGVGGVIDVPAESEPDDPPQDDDESDEADREDEHPGADEDSESDSEERDDIEDDELEEFEFIYGDVVHDREAEPPEDEDPEDLIVVNLPDAAIADWDCGDDGTLADRNTGYPPTDLVVVVVTRDTLGEEMPKWDERTEEIPLDALDDSSIDYSCYPSLRLELEEPSHLRTP